MGRHRYVSLSGYIPTEGVADDWEDMNNKCIANMKNLIAKYNTPVMMCEIGIPWDYSEAEDFSQTL